MKTSSFCAKFYHNVATKRGNIMANIYAFADDIFKLLLVITFLSILHIADSYLHNLPVLGLRDSNCY